MTALSDDFQAAEFIWKFTLFSRVLAMAKVKCAAHNG